MTTPRQADRMSRAPVDGIELEYETRGRGEPVVLIHGGLCADWFTVLLDQRELSDRYRLIRYHRIGYAGSDRADGPVSLHRQAAHCASLMHHLGIAQAHIVGHSSGANIALQLALDHPAAVRAWRFGHDEARRIEQPVLAVLGARSDDVTTTFHQRHTLLLSWLPNVEPFELPDATHLLHVHNPAGMATALAHFLLHLG